MGAGRMSQSPCADLRQDGRNKTGDSVFNRTNPEEIPFIHMTPEEAV